MQETPIRLLVAISNPTDLPQGLAVLDVAREIETIHEALGNLHARGFLEVTILAGRSGLPDELTAQLQADGYQLAAGSTTLDTIFRLLPRAHLFHFIGHGAFRGTGAQGSAALYLEDAQGRVAIAKEGDVLAKLRALSPTPQMIYLSACESAKRDVTHPFVGLAPRLLRAGVPAVVAMQEQVPIALARQLTGDFYRHLLEHGRVDVALNQARLYLYEHEASNWAIPVLYMRTA